MKAKVLGITRPADAAHTLLVTFDRCPTDDDMREAHDTLRDRFVPEPPAGSNGSTPGEPSAFVVTGNESTSYTES